MTLGEGFLVGRGPRCSLRIEDPLVSAEHARLRWCGDGWVIRDLGSSNGTVVDGDVLAPGKDHPLREGAALSFGNRDETWSLVDAGPPVARAISLEDEGGLQAEEGIVTLPTDDEPECQIFRDLDGHWLIERGGETARVADQQVIELRAGLWRLELPPPEEAVDSTHEAPAPVSWDLEDVSLRFTVSHDGEDVSLRIVARDETIDLGVRVYNDMLLELARFRLEEAAAHPRLDSAEHGWIYGDQLISRVALRDHGQLNQYVFHARKQLARLGIENAAQLIERGRRGRLRLGTARVTIEPR